MLPVLPVVPIISSHLAKGFGKVVERITWPFFFLFYLNPSLVPPQDSKKKQGSKKSLFSLFGQDTSRI